MTDREREEARAKLACDIAEFKRNGGKIEKIGNTPIKHHGFGVTIQQTANTRRARDKAKAEKERASNDKRD